MAHLLRVAATVLAAWAVLSVPLGVLVGRWLRRSRRAAQARCPGGRERPATAGADPRNQTAAAATAGAARPAQAATAGDARTGSAPAAAGADPAGPGPAGVRGGRSRRAG